ncbi:MAG TPA: PepSY-like domain-containing protein [Chitinophagaceae bacterium]
MKQIRFFFLLLGSSFFYATGFSQVTSVPEQAKENFAAQYPAAQKAKWNNDIVNVNVKFELDGETMNAEYSNKGTWKKTLQDWSYEKLDAVVQDGFQKSKYADRTVTEVKIVYLPGNVIQYRLKAEKNDVQKKYLYFNKFGRLLRDAATL